MPAVSVIIPVYNVEAYLRECVESVLSQTLSDIEIICVNDGSSDGSGDILREYAGQDDRIVVVEQDNRGLSGARNAGVAMARGEYLHFLDSDDFLDSSALADLYGHASRNRLDVVYFDAAPFFEDSTLEESHAAYKSYYVRKREYPGVMSGQELLAVMSETNDYRPSACLQLIRREYYTGAGLSFIEGLVHEDNPFSFVCMLKADRVEYLTKPYYLRRVRQDSLTTTEKGMAHFRGFLIGYLEMLRFSIQGDFSEATSQAMAKLCLEMYRHALKVYSGLPANQRETITQIDPSPEALLTCALITRQHDDVRKVHKLKKELKATRSKLEKVHNSRSYRAVRYLRRLFGSKR